MTHAPPNSNDMYYSPTFNNNCVSYDDVLNYDGKNSMMDMSSENNDNPPDVCTNVNNTDPCVTLKKLKINNLSRLVIGHLNMNSLRNKFESLKQLIKANIDILVITESKLDDSFPSQQFDIEGYGLPYRLDKNASSGGVLIYIREDIPCRELTNHDIENNNIEGIFLEINLRKTK